MRDHGELVQSTAMADSDAIEKQSIDDIVIVADKFQRQLQSLFAANTLPEDDAPVQQRVHKAADYFTDKLQSGLSKWASAFDFDTDNKDIRKQLNQALESLRHQLAVKTHALQSCREGFATGTYLNALAHAEIDFNSPPSAKKHAVEVNATDVQHPQLLQALKAWRAEQAAAEQVEHYRILHQRVLLQIAAQLPDTQHALLQINGVGKATVEKYAAPITALVNDYCREQAIEPQQLPADSERG
ncbi:MAG: HRDC domain-containing protein [Gammaproteobacteria bacterium]|nr:HRDC domain-containing protein [Gammaproteobacteria bacterium]